jgi:ubiquinone/menaquinone biosynthesis C-methylase UbiE
MKDQPMSQDIEKGVAQAYDARWLSVPSLDDVAPARKGYARWDDLRPCTKDYAARGRLRLLRYIPSSGDNILDVGSGPLLFKEYVEYSRNFRKRYCVDLSTVALEQARRKIGDHGVFLQGSLFDVPLEPDFFDCTLCVLTIFNIHKDQQEDAVRKLVEVTKPGKPVIVVYCNPSELRSGGSLLRRFREFLKPRKKALKRKEKPAREGTAPLYYHRHPIEWWDRFSDVAGIDIFPWAYFYPDTQKMLIPDNRLGKRLLDALFMIEERFPRFLGRRCAYPIIVLTKKTQPGR